MAYNSGITRLEVLDGGLSLLRLSSCTLALRGSGSPGIPGCATRLLFITPACLLSTPPRPVIQPYTSQTRLFGKHDCSTSGTFRERKSFRGQHRPNRSCCPTCPYTSSAISSASWKSPFFSGAPQYGHGRLSEDTNTHPCIVSKQTGQTALGIVIS